ncbi:MAG: CoA pyrophosphatase [Breznakibacter sp.]
MELKELMKYAFTGELPGLRAHMRMAPPHRFPDGAVTSAVGARNSSVMVLLYFKEGRLHIPLIQRPLYNGAHSGQVSFPGGKWEPSDQNAWDAALRETFEETGIAGNVERIGQLSPLYIPHSNFMVYPFVGIYNGQPAFDPDPFEVEQLMEVPVDEFFSADNLADFFYQKDDFELVAPSYRIGGRSVWGATAMILSEFVELIEPFVKNRFLPGQWQIQQGA